VLRDPNEIPHRKGINQIIAPDAHSLGASRQFAETRQSILFTASRDRLIKLWQVNPNKPAQEDLSKNLLVNFDGHSDWVN
jgi:hypothetical protein